MTYVSSYDRHAVTPKVGDRGVWGKPKKRIGLGGEETVIPAEPTEVIEVKWNGEEWWIKTRGPYHGECWNDLSVFRESFRPS